MKTKVFIDGKEGTTGLKIFERFAKRDDLEILLIDEDKRKDSAERAKMINSSDFTFLCLPDAAAREAVSLCTNPDVKIIDASTAHRTDPAWDYGFPELSEKHRENIRNSKRVAVPGCYASGFISLCYPLVQAGVLPEDYPVTCHAVSGYSGAGKKMIAVIESDDKTFEMQSPRQYALGQTHKHLPEMQKICALDAPPVFCPVVAPYYAGMEVTVPLFGPDSLADEIRAVYRELYDGRNGMIRYAESPDEGGFLSAGAYAGRDDMEVSVWGGGGRILLTARFDNLGKGASGAAIQNMNLALGFAEDAGLIG